MADSYLKALAKKVRAIGNFWIAKQTPEHLEVLRTNELDVARGFFPQSGRVLEIGAGAGWQAKALNCHGYDVCAIDIFGGNYGADRVWPVELYDGEKIPFKSNSFDVVFSSNVMEHIASLEDYQKEIWRVLNDDGVVVHVLPSSCWRFWSNITEVIRFWTFPKSHGEHAENSIYEIYYFSRRWWNKVFVGAGWKVVGIYSNGLFYTGASILDYRLSMSARRFFSSFIGGSCNVYVLRKTNR